MTPSILALLTSRRFVLSLGLALSLDSGQWTGPLGSPRMAWADPAPQSSPLPPDQPSMDHWQALTRSYELLACPPDLRHAMRELRTRCEMQVPSVPERSRGRVSSTEKVGVRPPSRGASSAPLACSLSSMTRDIKELESDLRLELKLRLQLLPHAVVHFGKTEDDKPLSLGRDREARLRELTVGPLLSFTRFLLVTGDAGEGQSADARLDKVRRYLIGELGVPGSQIERPWKWLLAKNSEQLVYPIFDQPSEQEPDDVGRSVYVIRIDCR